MIGFEVGKRFPYEQYLKLGEITVSMINEYFFDVFLSLKTKTKNVINTWSKGYLCVYLYDKLAIPFIIFDFGNGFTIDVNINIKKIHAEKIDEWLEYEDNIINMHLVEATTGILVAERMLVMQPNIAKRIKEICKRQKGFTLNELYNIIDKAVNGLTAQDMMQESVLNQIFEEV